MKTYFIVSLAAAALILGTAPNTFAGVGGLLAKAGKTLFGKGAKVTGRTGSTVARAGGKATASAAGRAGTTVFTRGAQVTAASAPKIVAVQLGAAGTRAMARLGPASGKKLAEVSSLLARSPHKTAWLDTIGKYGGSAVDFLYKHKAGIAVGTFATAAVLRPADFLETVGTITSSTVNATGEYLVKPVVTGTTEHIIGPAINRVVDRATAGWWLFPLMTSGVIAGLFWWKLRATT